MQKTVYASFITLLQSIILAFLTFATLIYTIKKSSIRTKNITSPSISVLIGLSLGMMSSFLGIGGGPINIVVLHYFFSMDAKTASTNSLFVILLSQIVGLILTIATNTVPSFNTFSLLLMCSGGVCGSIVGRRVYARINNESVNRLFLVLLVIILCICVLNSFEALNTII